MVLLCWITTYELLLIKLEQPPTIVDFYVLQHYFVEVCWYKWFSGLFRVLSNTVEVRYSDIVHHCHCGEPESLYCTKFQIFYVTFEIVSSLHLWISSSTTMSL